MKMEKEEGAYGEEGEARLAADVEPWLDLALRSDCRAFASAFSCVRTKYARFCIVKSARRVCKSEDCPRDLYEDLSIFCVHSSVRTTPHA